MSSLLFKTESIANLGGAAAVNGVAHDLSVSRSSLDRFRAFAVSDQAGTLSVQQSVDGTTWHELGTQAVSANTPVQIEVKIVLPLVRVRYVNGATPQTSFLLASALVPAA